MRTPKIYSLYALIDFLNNKNSQLNLVKLPLCSKPLNEDAWLSGMIESMVILVLEPLILVNILK